MGTYPNRVGRPPVKDAVVSSIERMARKNPRGRPENPGRAAHARSPRGGVDDPRCPPAVADTPGAAPETPTRPGDSACPPGLDHAGGRLLLGGPRGDTPADLRVRARQPIREGVRAHYQSRTHRPYVDLRSVTSASDTYGVRSATVEGRTGPRPAPAATDPSRRGAQL